MSKKELSVEEKLRALYKLQLIDSKIDAIKATRGELPLEVEDLEDEVAGMENKLSKLSAKIGDLQNQIKESKIVKQQASESIKKYEEQQKNVRNNREFDAITKEIEYQNLEIELAEKRVKDHTFSIGNIQEVIEEVKANIRDKKEYLEYKKTELNSILEETEKEENLLIKKSKEFSRMIEEKYLKAYKKIRNRVNNGLAVVSIERGAASGSFFTIPPQIQLEIANRNKIIVDETQWKNPCRCRFG